MKKQLEETMEQFETQRKLHIEKVETQCAATLKE